MKNIFYSTLDFAAFVKKDIGIFTQKHQLYAFQFRPYPKWKTPFSFIKQLLSIVYHLFWTDIYICQFGGYHTFLPAFIGKLTGKPCIIITGGTDCVSFPSLNYGNFHKKGLGLFTKWSYQLASYIASVHKSLIYCDYTYQKEDFAQQGIKAFCKGIQTPMSEITNGYDFSFFKNIAPNKKANSFITIAVGATSALRFKLKGIDLTIELANQFPDYSFTIVGVSQTTQTFPPNVTTFPVVTPEKLRELLSEHEFYLQLSISEGFPNAPCEAMLCECIPIGSSVGALPDIIGEAGFILTERNTELLNQLVTKAVNSDKKALSKAARQRIINEFPLSKRANALLGLIEHLTK